jgi:acetyltransferase-like isoleucine patch superfamily enzyme
MAWVNAHLEHDWFPRPLPTNIELGRNAYLESAYGFAGFFSEREPGLIMGEGSGAYGLTSFFAGRDGRIEVGPYTCLNSAALCCDERITIGAHCLLAWGSVITDTPVPGPESIERRRQALFDIASDPRRRPRPMGDTAPVTIEDNVWIGFGSVINAGIRLGRGSVVGCKTIVTKDVLPYTVVVGNPARVIRVLDPDDTPEVRRAALHEFGLSFPKVGA